MCNQHLKSNSSGIYHFPFSRGPNLSWFLTSASPAQWRCGTVLFYREDELGDRAVPDSARAGSTDHALVSMFRHCSTRGGVNEAAQAKVPLLNERWQREK